MRVSVVAQAGPQWLRDGIRQIGVVGLVYRPRIPTLVVARSVNCHRDKQCEIFKGRHGNRHTERKEPNTELAR